ncbi:MAG: recombinase family protein [Chloroflexota bacterium]|nr:recombinase family protein [Chloroflexota bacterium]
MKTIAMYARVSTPQQEQQGTIQSQIAALNAYAAAHGWRIAPEHAYVDEGYSGARLDRPGLEHLRDAAWRGELDAVLILAPDRLARHYAYQYVVVEELERAGCAIIFVNGPFDTAPEQRLVREVQGLFAEFERAALQERSRRGKLHAARQGRFFTGAAAYGYTYLKAQDGQPGRCVINEAEATIVQQMFRWLIEEQLSTQGIARRLTDQQVPTRHGALPWSPASVHKILSNPLYTGRHYYNRSENAPEGVPAGRRPTKEPRRRLRPRDEWIAVPWPAILSEEMFAMAARQLQLNRERSPRRTRYQYLLQGLLVCGYCGRRLGGHAGVATGRYECTRRRSLEPAERRCQLRSISQPDIEPVVWAHIVQLLEQPAVLMTYLQQQQAEDGPEVSDGQRELRRIQRQRTALEREAQRLIDAYQVGVLEVEELRERRQRLREAGQQLQQREELVTRQLAQAAHTETLAETVQAFCERLSARLVDPSFALKQQVLRLVVERITVTDDEIVIQHIIPMEPSSRLYLRPSRTREPPGRADSGTRVECQAAGGRPTGAGVCGAAPALPRSTECCGAAADRRVSAGCASPLAGTDHEPGGTETASPLPNPRCDPHLDRGDDRHRDSLAE